MFSIGTDLKLQGLQRRSNSYFEVRLGNASTSDCNLEVFSELLATAELEDVPEATQPQEVAEVSTSPTSQEVPPNDNPTTELPDDSENPENITLLRWNQIISTLSKWLYLSQFTNKNSTLVMSFSLDSTLAPKFEARVESWKFGARLNSSLKLGG